MNNKPEGLPRVEKACQIETDKQGNVPLEAIARHEANYELKHFTPSSLGWFAICSTEGCKKAIIIQGGSRKIWLPRHCPLRSLVTADIPTQSAPTTIS